MQNARHKTTIQEQQNRDNPVPENDALSTVVDEVASRAVKDPSEYLKESIVPEGGE